MVGNFDKSFDLLMEHEVGSSPDGGYVNDPRDPGGETKWGVTKRVAIKWGYSGKMMDLSKETAKEIAKSYYWDIYKCDEFDQRVAFQIFDCAYNGGSIIKWLQQSVGVSVDGTMGPDTISSIKKHDTLSLVLKINNYRLKYYTSLKKLWPTFGAGWSNRVANNLMEAAKDD